MNWSRAYWRFAVALILYIAFVMLFPLIASWPIPAAFLALIPVSLAATSRIWAGGFLSVINVPVTLVIASRTDRVALGSLLLHYMVPLVAIMIIGILVGTLVRTLQERADLKSVLLKTSGERDYLRSRIGATVRQTISLLDRSDSTSSSAILPLLYESAYGQQVPSRTELGAYFQTIIPDLFPPGIEGEWETEFDRCTVEPETAIQLGLAVAKMTSNMLAYGRQKDAPPWFSLELTAEEDGLTIRFCDRGPGFPDTFVRDTAEVGNSLSCLRDIASHFHGSLTLRNENGACCILEFPVTLILS